LWGKTPWGFDELEKKHGGLPAGHPHHCWVIPGGARFPVCAGGGAGAAAGPGQRWPNFGGALRPVGFGSVARTRVCWGGRGRGPWAAGGRRGFTGMAVAGRGPHWVVLNFRSQICGFIHNNLAGGGALRAAHQSAGRNLGSFDGNLDGPLGGNDWFGGEHVAGRVEGRKGDRGGRGGLHRGLGGGGISDVGFLSSRGPCFTCFLPRRVWLARGFLLFMGGGPGGPGHTKPGRFSRTRSGCAGVIISFSDGKTPPCPRGGG